MSILESVAPATEAAVETSTAEEQSAPSQFSGFYDESGLRGDVLDSIPSDLTHARNMVQKYPSQKDYWVGMENALEMARGKALEPLHEGSTDKEKEFFTKTIRNANGVPETAEGYGLKAPEEIPEGMAFDEGMLTKFGELSHKHNLSPDAVNELMAFDMERQQAILEGSQTTVEEYQTQQIQELKAEYGDNYDNIIKDATNGARTIAKAMGVEEDQVIDMATDAFTIKAFKAVADLLSEDSIVTGSKDPSKVESIKQQYNAILEDPANKYHQDLFSDDPQRQERGQREKLRLAKIIEEQKGR